MFRASSTARTEPMPWTSVQTPPIRCAKAQALRGSRSRQNDLDAAHHRSGTRSPGDPGAVEFRLDSEVPLDPRDGTDDDGLCAHVRSPHAASLFDTNSRRLCGVLFHLK